MMMKEIRGPNFSGGIAKVRFITTREEANDNIKYFEQLITLYKQLTDRWAAGNSHQLVGSNLHFIFITDGCNLVGTATLAMVKTAMRCKGLIEDVVVDQQYRKADLGKALIQNMIALAKEKGCKRLELTSKPERAGTACLYLKQGFELIAEAVPGNPEATNLYRMEL